MQPVSCFQPHARSTLFIVQSQARLRELAFAHLKPALTSLANFAIPCLCARHRLYHIGTHAVITFSYSGSTLYYVCLHRTDVYEYHIGPLLDWIKR